MARTDTLGNFLTDVADAIREKTGSSDTITASNFDTAIANIPSGGKYAPRKISFYAFTGTDLSDEISGLDTKNIADVSYMFYNCQQLTSVDLSSLDLSNATNLSYMFYYCKALTTAVFPSATNSKVTTFQNMFYYADHLQTVDLSAFTNNGVSPEFSGMFRGCTSLSHVDLRGIEFARGRVAGLSYMFASVPSDCEIIVKNATSRQYLLDYASSSLTNIKTVEEYEAE